MSPENGKTVFEEAAAERELEELRRAIEESRGRRRRANEAFDAFLKGFAESRRAAVPATHEVKPPAPQEEPPKPEPREQEPIDEGLLAFAPAPSAPVSPAASVAPPGPSAGSPLDQFAQEGAAAEKPGLRPIPAALAAVRRSPGRRMGYVVVVAAAVGVVAAVLLWRGRSAEEPAAHAPVALPPAASASEPSPPAAAATASEPPPSAEISATRRVWLRVMADGARVVEREVEAGTTIPVRATSQILIRTGDAGAVRISIAGKDQGLLGATGQVVTRTFTLPRESR